MTISVPDFSKARVLVVGDLMLDRYWSGPCSRISPEAPVPVVKVEQLEDRPGGAGNVALNIAGLGGRVHVVGLVGTDAAAESLSTQLSNANVTCDFVEVKGSSTITKLRTLAQNQQLLRLDFEDGFSGVSSEAIIEKVRSLIDNCDVLLLSDYGKGALTDSQSLIKLAMERGVPVAVDPKGGDFSRYCGAAVVTPNYSEFEAIVGRCANETEIEMRAQSLCVEHDIAALLVTRSEKGMSLFCRGEPAAHRPTNAREVYDVTGAGDTVIATLAGALAVGLPLEESMTLANFAAGVVVGKLGTATVNASELRQAARTHTPLRRGIVTESQLEELLQQARDAGERIVFTNGCFDILHAGHVAYLSRARELGDRLIVAVNDDASVRRLKGDERPINTVDLRMAVLSGLEAVDWVLPFSEDTPARLIDRITPDVLVKGGDWAPKDIVGYETVTANGGEVLSLEFLDGCSTTEIINAIRKSR